MLDIGEAIRELGEVKDALDMEVKQNFIDPLQNLHDKDLKEIQVTRGQKHTLTMQVCVCNKKGNFDKGRSCGEKPYSAHLCRDKMGGMRIRTEA